MGLKIDYWAISHSPLKLPIHCNFEETLVGKWLVYCNRTIKYVDDLGIIVDGNIMPRISYTEEFANTVDVDLVFRAYKKHGSNFVDYVKGMFTVVVLDKDSIKVFTDRSGMGKYYTYCTDSDSVVTTSVEIIALNYVLNISSENIAIYNLMEHFIDRTTMYKNVNSSLPASVLELTDTMKESQYWKRERLLSLQRKDFTFEEMAFRFRDIIKGYVDFYNPTSPTMTLTGGNDSRAILAALLNIGTKPRAFTFGNPKSYDGVIAEEIAKKASLEYNCYFRENPTQEWFRSKASKIVEMGNTLLNIHRTHRLEAIQREITKYGDTDMIFCGFMGGDYIKGINYDDYITAKLLRVNEYEKGDLDSKIEQIAAENFVKLGSYNKERVISKLKSQPCFSDGRKRDREFSYVFDVIGCLHDFQDTNIFANHVPVVVNIYMDIDFLDLLFSSKYSMMDKDNSSRNQLKRMNQPALHCNIINILAPSLNSIEFAKNYSPQEFLGNRLIYLAKRAYRLYFRKNYPENFPYGNWFRKYVESIMNNIPDEVAHLYDIAKYKESLLRENSISMEKQWHKYSNLVNIIENYKYFSSKRRTSCKDE